jgi:hypothetical protein
MSRPATATISPDGRYLTILDELSGVTCVQVPITSGVKSLGNRWAWQSLAVAILFACESRESKPIPIDGIHAMEVAGALGRILAEMDKAIIHDDVYHDGQKCPKHTNAPTPACLSESVTAAMSEGGV